CSVRWDDMSGDERARMCGLCQKRVYNLVNLRRDEIDALIEANEGRVCVRMYKRPDGTVLTADCPVGATRLGRWKHQAQRRLINAVGVAAALLGAGGLGVSLFG